MNKAQLLAWMEKGATIITPNNRLSKELLKEFLQAFPKPVQRKPLCLPYTAFIKQAFKEFGYLCLHEQHPILLSSQQSRYIWQYILAQEQSLTNAGLLDALEEAWTRCHLWGLDLNHAAFTYTPQTQQFQHWAQEFKLQLQGIKAITEVQVVPYLCAHRHCFNTGAGIIWACFDDYHPQQRTLQDYFLASGVLQYHFDLEPQSNFTYQFAALNAEDEQKQLIAWIKERLEHGDKHIGIVTPNLEGEASSLQRALMRYFSDSEINISLGKSLTDYPLVAHALSWLKLDTNTLESQQVRLLLYSPYLGYAQTELLERAQLLENHILLTEPRCELTAFIAAINNKVPQLGSLLKQLETYPEQATVQEWIELFHLRLKALGFPGEIHFDSQLYQCYQRFLLLFDEFKELTLVTPSLNRKEALLAFNSLAQAVIFQPEKVDAPIQILGMLEAAGCIFDSLWIAGLTDEYLPRAVKPSAFIPLPLQREKSMPLSDFAHELSLAEKMISRFQSASQRTIFSYPCLTNDKPNLPSPLITHFSPFTPKWEEITMTKIALQNLTEDYLFPLIAQEEISGGTALLSNQAKCPFRAFAAHRLHVKESTQAFAGLNLSERGQLVHKVMETLWTKIKTQANLLSLTTEELDQHIDFSITVALQPFIRQRPYSFSTLMQQVEIERLKRLVHLCLKWERLRPPFEVDALEEVLTVRLAEMEFTVRVDRIDKVAGEKKWVIDYKSSLPASLPWNDERPSEPQLLLYALLDASINTLLFVRLKSGQFIVKGLSETKEPHLGLAGLKAKQTWQTTRQQWERQLSGLAQEYAQGYCPPKPSTAAVCQQCNYHNLCRIDDSEQE
jgi:ATP-dependent helicase/nuclease subunit B